MNKSLKLQIVAILSLISSVGFSESASEILANNKLESMPAKSVSSTGTAVKQGAIVQVSIPVTYSVSNCYHFDKSNMVAFVESALPNAVNEEQRAYEVRSYFAKNKNANAMMASTSLFSLPNNCEKKVEQSQTMTLKLKMSADVSVLATTVSIPMEKEMGRFLVLVDIITGKVKVMPIGNMGSSELYNKLFSMI